MRAWRTYWRAGSAAHVAAGRWELSFHWPTWRDAWAVVRHGKTYDVSWYAKLVRRDDKYRSEQWSVSYSPESGQGLRAARLSWFGGRIISTARKT